MCIRDRSKVVQNLNAPKLQFKSWFISVLQFNIRNDQGAAKASILKLMPNIQLKVVIFFFMNLWIARNIISVFIKWTQFEVVSQVQLRKQIVETMVACHMKAKYIYTYVGLTTMIWEIQQMNSKSNVCICICKIWIQIQIQTQMHHRHHQLWQDLLVWIYLFVIIILLHLSNLWLFDGSLMPLMQWISCLPSKQKCLPTKFGYLYSQIGYLHKALCLFYAGTLNIKC